MPTNEKGRDRGDGAALGTAHAPGNPSTATRSAENWFLDAAILAHDDDLTNALAAAENGLEALARERDSGGGQ